jgi:hypothetical protein
MTNVINFPYVKVGEVVVLDFENELIECLVTNELPNCTYEVKALVGKYQGLTATVRIAE